MGVVVVVGGECGKFPSGFQPYSTSEWLRTIVRNLNACSYNLSGCTFQINHVLSSCHTKNVNPLQFNFEFEVLLSSPKHFIILASF